MKGPASRDPARRRRSAPAARAAAPEYVRFETADGWGLFHACSEFLTYAGHRGGKGGIRVARKALREIEALYAWLGTHTDPPPRDAYDDELSRRPATWFKPSAVEHIRRADQLCRLLNREGVDIWRVARQRPGRILWEDEVQAITRAPRRPQRPITKLRTIVERRHAARRRRQQRRRMRHGRLAARRLKSSLDAG